MAVAIGWVWQVDHSVSEGSVSVDLELGSSVWVPMKSYAQHSRVACGSLDAGEESGEEHSIEGIVDGLADDGHRESWWSNTIEKTVPGGRGGC